MLASSVHAQSLLPTAGHDVLPVCMMLLSCHKVTPPPTWRDRWPDQDPNFTHADLIIVGDSIAWQWHRVGALNHGIGGQRMDEIAYAFAADVLVYRPRAVLIEGGINDFVAWKSVETVLQYRVKLLRLAQQSGIKVYMTTVTPIAPGRNGCHPEFARALDKIGPFNDAIARICTAKNGCTLVDIFSAVGGKFNPDLYADCVHFNAAGYALMDRAMDQAN